MEPIRPHDLPDFENPPVVETVLAVQFRPLRRMRAAHFGLFWNEIRGLFPVTEERPPLDPVLERFPGPVNRPLPLRPPPGGPPPLPRVWYIHRNQNELLQLQADRLIRNWRKIGDEDAYPRYEIVRQRFDEDFKLFQRFAAREDLGPIEVNQCEITYVNHIVAGDGWTAHEEIGEVLTVWKHPGGPFPGKAEDVAFHARFVIPGPNGHPAGRLHVDVQPAFRKRDNKPIFVLNLTARGMAGDATGFFDLGREWIVRSFAEMTTPQMHGVWRRRH